MDALIQVLEKEPAAPRSINRLVDRDLETIATADSSSPLSARPKIWDSPPTDQQDTGACIHRK